jgi:hypothetical protein
MTLPIDAQIMDALAALLQGAAATEDRSDIPGVGLLLLDPSRVATEGDGVVVQLEQGDTGEGIARDKVADICRVQTTLPIMVTIYMPRKPGDPPNWRLLGPFYAEVHRRIMATPRTLGGLCQGIQSSGRQFPEPDSQACWLRLLYTVTYKTAEHDVTVNR